MAAKLISQANNSGNTMNTLRSLYRPSLALLTDLYQLTMGYAYWKNAMHEAEAVFHLFFRRQPFNGGFTIACGLSEVIDLLSDFHFSENDISYLKTLTGNDGEPLFDEAYLSHLADMRFRCSVDAIPEGTVVFPQEPLIRVRGPILQAQLIETALLTMTNFQSLVATKAARVVAAAGGGPVVEFGLRRAQGVDGGVSASRAAYVGGCAGTSNVLAGQIYGIPVKGTHAHSWVMCFDDELDSFNAYADAMPNNCVFLVDTYDTLQGVRNAVTAGKRLRAKGHEMIGIRLDSGDLAYLSKEARCLLDDAGFPNAAIIASNDLDEHIIESLRTQRAPIGVWGVGTKLATAYDQPALGGVYKLAAVHDENGTWAHRIKLSNQTAKVTTPGILQVRRCVLDGMACGDMIFDELTHVDDERLIVDPMDATRRKRLPAQAKASNLLEPIFRTGELVYERPSLETVRQRTFDQLTLFHEGIKRLVNPHEYPVGLESALHRRKTEMILAAREKGQPEK